MITMLHLGDKAEQKFQNILKKIIAFSVMKCSRLNRCAHDRTFLDTSL